MAATNSGVFRTDNSAGTWSHSSAGMGIKQTTSIDTSGGIVFCGTKLNGVYVSQDTGKTWTKSASNISWVNDIAVHSTPISSVIMAAGVGGVDKSTNNRQTWTTINNGLTSLTGQSILGYSIGTTNYFVLGTANGLFVSTNSGDSWINKSNGLTNTDIRTIKQYMDGTISVLLAGTFGGGLFKSTDNGDNWSPANNQLTNLFILSLFKLGNDIFARTSGGGIFHTTINSFLWTSINNGLSALIVNSFMKFGSQLFAATNGGIFSSLIGTFNWSPSNSGINNSVINTMSVFNLTLFAGTSQGLYKSTDIGNSWSKSALPVSYVTSLLLNTALMLVGSPFEGYFESTDGGNTWYPVNNGLPVFDEVRKFVKTKNSNYMAATNSNGLFISTDWGKSWVPANNGMTPVKINDVIYVDDEDDFELAATLSGAYQSSDEGNSWNPVPDFIGKNVISLTYGNGTTLVVTSDSVYAASSNILQAGSFKSIGTKLPLNSGNSAFENAKVLRLKLGNGNDRFAFFSDQEVYISKNGFDSWYKLDDTWPEANPSSVSLAISYSLPKSSNTQAASSYLIASTAGLGGWKRKLDDLITGVERNDNKHPDNFALLQNYPNPFNPSTIIKYQLPVSSYVSLIVYDILGRKAAELINSQWKKAGYHQFNFSAGSYNLSSGVYFYRIQTDGFSDVKKFVVLK